MESISQVDVRRAHARRAARFASGLLLALTLGACSTWSGAHSPATLAERSEPSGARVVLRDGSTVDVIRPRIRGDSLVGFVWSNGETPYAVPTAAVSHIQLRTIHPTRSIALTLGILGVAGYVFIATLRDAYGT